MQNSVKSMSEHGFTQFEITSNLLRNLNKFNLTPVTKLVLLELTTHLNEDKNGSVVFPSVNYIADVLGIGLTATKKAIKDLINEGLIIKSKRSKVQGNYNKYLINPKVQNLTCERSENECFKKTDNDRFLITNKKRINKKQTKTNVVVLNQIPDIIKNNEKIKNKCAYWASLSNEIKQDYVNKDKQQKAKELDRQAFIERKKQQERQKAKEQQELIAECHKPLSEQFTYESACTLIRNIAKLNKSFAYRGLPKELSIVFNINIDEIV